MKAVDLTEKVTPIVVSYSPDEEGGFVRRETHKSQRWAHVEEKGENKYRVTLRQGEESAPTWLLWNKLRLKKEKCVLSSDRKWCLLEMRGA